MILKLMARGVIVFSARIVKFVVESVVTGSAIGRTLLGSGKGVGQSGPFTVGNRPCDSCCGDYKMLCEFGGQWHVVRPLESGTVIMEVKVGVYEPTGPEDVMEA